MAEALFLDALRSAADTARSLLCVGLDFDPEKTPEAYRNDPFAYNKLIIDATSHCVCAYKPNSAFYEALGIQGMEALKATIDYIPDHIPVILDAKRGDIGNTSKKYARMAFTYLGADAITVSPYMGSDSVTPFLEFPGKGVFVLCLTSNPGASDFQRTIVNGIPLYLHVADKCGQWAQSKNNTVGLVVGATNNEIEEIRARSSLPFLVPGVGAQGGDLEKAVRQGNMGGIAIINSSRGIIYPKGKDTTAADITAEAEKIRAAIQTVTSAL
ncbi:MAG: orotidine 5'-phosphate decarboxylase [Candidatus Raymondbacteria bacterium RifOxyA12_full_50_37]|nr:MAG: orotidine 5'-phosphate decarboxylase [Candidatus Raymondbacteria bacterium RifOxyA12_full_50_37]OGJ86055.1 MAG: orotidine 5'-phosphate decarboxylase [Candidatus Raymondbacteria bacterium RIFOXYA2_FULL_49_16]OGJ95952.1 MAG: orotidine 5'-phosphate decarboxylase [Candidatus Raymondbacteria bacterium RIFOXYC2_FULL_50_21]OGK03902.1 MAG: orotidine 5'-phosphate decarboxylase [Candidatus Raymondbacteria bacterium RifOxyB12_full_50_8]OGP40393.1 MAG: orotidine 5'-phosphate decarboxylase [Candidat